MQTNSIFIAEACISVVQVLLHPAVPRYNRYFLSRSTANVAAGNKTNVVILLRQTDIFPFLPFQMVGSSRQINSDAVRLSK